MAVIDRLQDWAHRAGQLPLRHIPPDEQVVINDRQHPAVLVLKTIRTGSGVGMMISGPTIGLVLLFTGAVLLSTVRSPTTFSRGWVVALVFVLTIAVFFVAHDGGPLLRTLAGLAILLWILADVITWFYDRLIVTDRRLYRVHGLLLTHHQSVALQTITVVDLELGPAARFFGTLRFDTPAQRDGPLHRFTYVRDPSAVHITILQLRASAATKSPPPY